MADEDTEGTTPRIVSIQVGRPREVAQHRRSGDTIVTTAIFKEPVVGRVMLRRLDIDGDEQADLTVHGGPEKAVYVYPVEHYKFWRHELPDATLQNGIFGENLTIRGLTEAEVHVGDRFRIGGAEVYVTQPRLPCYKLAVRFGRPDMLKRFLASRRTGWYLAVTQEGEIGGGAALEFLGGDADAVTIADITELYIHDRGNADLLRRAVATPKMTENWRELFAERLAELGVEA